MKKRDILDIRKSKIVINQADTRIIKFRKRHDTITQPVFDFRVNDKNLRDLIHMSDRTAPDLVPGLQSNFTPKERRRYVNRLLGKVTPDLQSRRVALLVCPIDGDLACDTIGCRISFDKEVGTVTWDDFAWDGNHEGDEVDDGDEPYEKVKGLNSFTFDEREYWWLLYQILQDLDVKGEIDP